MRKERLRRLVNDPRFERFIIALIIVNSVTLALETNDAAMQRFGPILVAIDRSILAVFVVELVLRMATGFRAFWRDPWRIFDFVVVAIALIPATGPLSILRALRILRVLRLVSIVPSMQRVVAGLLRALPGMGAIVMLIGLLFFVFSVIATKLYSDSFPDWFGTLGASAYTLFQIMTLESWSMGIVRPVMEVHPHAWLLFVPFIVMTAFTVLNLFIGVIVDAMQTEHAAEAREQRGQMMHDTEAILDELRGLKAEVAALRAARDR